VSDSGIYIPSSAAAEVAEGQLAEAISSFIRVTREGLSEIVAPRTLDGSRTATAAAYLARGLVLLEEGEECSSARNLSELGLRVIFELATRGRYLIVHPDGSDEYLRMLGALLKSEEKHSKALGTLAPGLPPFLASEVSRTGKKPRDLASIARELDDIDGRSKDDPHSARKGYAVIYGPVSDSAVHASLQMVKRFSSGDGGVLTITTNPPPLLTGRPLVVAAGRLGDLALDVFDSFDLNSDALRATGVRSAESDSNPRDP
jgi:hypothetical protein